MERYSLKPMLLVLLASGCMTATEVEATAVDEAVAPSVNPSTIHVGEETEATEFACSPKLGLCIAKVRGLTWAVHPESVARISGYEVGQTVRVKGVAPGRAWVIASARVGRDSSALDVIP